MKKRVYFIFKFSLGFVITILVLEIFLRLTRISLPSIVMMDARLGRVFKPNARLMVLSEGFGMGRINKYGYTGPAYPPERNHDALRIALMGDSYVEGHYLFERFYFGRILEKELSRFLNRKVEVLNFGMAGFDFRRMYIFYKERVANFHPDLTLFFVGTGDLVEKDNNLGPDCYLENGSLKISYDFARSRQFKLKTKYEFIRELSIYPLMQKAYALYRSGHGADILLGALNPFKNSDNKDAAKPPTPGTDPLFKVSKSVLDTLAAINDNGKTRNIIVLKNEIPAYYKKEITRLGLPLVDLAPELAKLKSRGIDPHYWKATNKMGHWNHEAHRMIGNFLARHLALHNLFIGKNGKTRRRNE